MATANPVLDQIFKQTDTAIAQSESVRAANMDLIREAERMQIDVSKSYTDLAAAERLVSLTKSAGELQAQKAIQRDAFAAGLDPGSTSNDMIDALAKSREATHETEALMKKWRSNQTLSFLDDPAQWVVNRMEESTLKEQLTQSAAMADFQNKRAQNLAQNVQQATITENAIKTTISAASAEAAATVVATEAEIRARKAAFEGFAANNKGVQFALDATKEQLGFLYNKKNAMAQEQNTEIALKNLDIRKKEFEFNSEMRLEAVEAKKEAKSVDEWALSRIRRGMLSYGFSDNITGPAVKNLMQLYRAGDPDMIKYFKSGMYSFSIDPTGSKSIIGTTPAESARGLSTGHNLPPGRSGARGILERAVEAAADPKNMLDPKKDPAKYDQFINKFVKQEVTRDAENITPTSARFIGDLKSYLGDAETPGIGALMALPISQKVFAPIIAKGQALNDPTLIRSLGVQAVLKGVITSSDYTSGLSQIFSQANEINLQSNDYVGLGIRIPNAGKDYIVRKGAFAGKINMADPVELGQQLAEDLARYVGSTGQGRRGGTASEFRKTFNPGE
jgi:hypothetical protein